MIDLKIKDTCINIDISEFEKKTLSSKISVCEILEGRISDYKISVSIEKIKVK